MQQLHPRAVWLFFVNSVMVGAGILIAVPFALLGIFLSDSGEREISLTTPILIGIAVVVAYLLIAWIWAKLSYRFYQYELREDGFRKEHGVIWKKYITIPYDRIQNVDIHRGILARLLGISDLQIQTAGAITAGSYGAFSEGRLPGIAKDVAEQIRDELIARTRNSRSQGL